MKKLMFVVLAGALMACGQQSTEEKSEVAEATKQEESTDDSVSGSYGSELSDQDEVTMDLMSSTLSESEKFEGKIRIEIDNVCQNKGCWMTTTLPDGQEMRITFKDYGFFVPKASGGYTAIIEGEAIKKITDAETLKHYAEESGKSEEEIAAIDGPEEEINFVATGVVIQPN